MNANDERRKQNFVDSLLHSLYGTDKERARELVNAGMKRLAGKDRAVAAASANDGGVRSSLSARTFPSWLTVGAAMAALVLIVISIPMMASSQNPLASIQQSLDQSLQDIGRHYAVTIVNRQSKDQVQNLHADLYVKGGDQFAICVRMSDAQVDPIWHGSNQHKSWAITPMGPVSVGKGKNLVPWLVRRDGISTPYLHITTALESMKQRYQLNLANDDELVFDGVPVRCRRVVGYLKEGLVNPANTSLPPDQIELWASRKTGVAMKIVVTWNLTEDQIGRESATIVFVEDVELSDQFFTPEGHGIGDQNRMNFKTND